MKIGDSFSFGLSSVFLIRKAYWRIVKRDGREIVKVICPKCLTEAALDHTVSPDGSIRPSVDCPGEACDFHMMCKLEDWDRTENFTSSP